MRYSHVVWDFDGTLFDTYPPMAKAFSEALGEIGISEPADEIMALMKISMGHAIKHYKEKYGIDDAFLARYKKLSEERQAAEVKPFDGVVEICRAVFEVGGSNYLYTHRGGSSTYFMEKSGIMAYFSELVTSANNFPRKPSPEGILYLIEKYKMQPDNVIMMGDRDLDIQAAKNAGAHTCFFSEEGEACAIAEYNIKNYRELYAILGIN